MVILALNIGQSLYMLWEDEPDGQKNSWKEAI